jgi:MoaA/NifB/PqqE/SkfB family radical SAM enzyme
MRFTAVAGFVGTVEHLGYVPHFGGPFTDAIVAAAVIEVLDELPRWWYRLKRVISIRRTGLKAIVSRDGSEAKEYLRSLLASANSGDSVLLVGRTHRELLQKNESDLAAVLTRGVDLKLLMLDQEALSNGLDLRPLQIPDVEQKLSSGLGDSAAVLKKLRDQCRQEGKPGSLLVYRTAVVVQNSAVILRPKRPQTPTRILYDFSFGTKDSEKFVQSYRLKRIPEGSFGHHLLTYCENLFSRDTASQAYDLTYRPARDGNHIKELERLAKESMEGLISAHTEFEEIRGNSLDRLAPRVIPAFKTLRERTSRAASPLSVQVELTNHCSTACEHCDRWHPTKRRDMEFDLAKRLLQQLADEHVTTITLSGGEPTQHPRFEELLRDAKLKGLSIGILSNGVGLTDSQVAAICQNASWLRLSVDGSSAAVYSRVRRQLAKGPEPFKAVAELVERFKDQKQRAGGECRLSFCYTIQNHNADDVANMIKWVSKLRLPESDKALTFKFAHGRDRRFLCTQEQVNSLLAMFKTEEFKDAANLRYLCWFLENQSSVPGVASGSPTLALYQQTSTRCFTPHLFALVSPSGDVFPCCFLFDDNSGYSADVEGRRREHSLGNLTTSSFRDIWNGNKYDRVRQELAEIRPTGNYSACGECTRHCNHNRWLTKLFQDYTGLSRAGGNADAVMNSVGNPQSRDGIWL